MSIVSILAAVAAGAAAGQAEELSVEQINARIRKHRTAEATLAVTDAEGRPIANAAVTVRQVRHKFLFGANAFHANPGNDSKLRAEYRKRFSDLMNYATLPFYWGGYERAEGRTRERELRAMAEWCRQSGIRPKGHPLCWHNVCPRWLRAKKPDEVLKLQLARIGRDVKSFAGLIDTWDVVNEPAVMPIWKDDPKNPISEVCRRIGRADLIKQTFAAARKANPKAALILNDYMTNEMYENIVKEALDASAEIDVIGIQSHMHRRYWGAKRVWDICERFAKYRKPLHFTELTILSGPLKKDSDWHGHHPGWDTTAAGERRQAKQAAELYTLLFSHPAVEAVTWWDFSDFRAWQGAPAGLVRKDMSPKPAYEALMKLIKGEWWTSELKLKTDAAGRVKFRGFLGTYKVYSAAGGGEFELAEAGEAKVAVKLAAPKRKANE